MSRREVGHCYHLSTHRPHHLSRGQASPDRTLWPRDLSLSPSLPPHTRVAGLQAAAAASSSSSSGLPSVGVVDSVEDMSTSLSLANIRNSLIRQEDTIIFHFIERAQFARNEAVYIPESIPIPRTPTYHT